MPNEPKATTVPEVSVNSLMREIGDTGTVVYSGYLSLVDYNQDLTGTRRIRKYDEMRLSDSTVRLGLAAVKYPILATQWFIKSPQDSGEDDEATKFVRAQLLENPLFTWNSYLRQILTFCDYGNAIFEKVFIKLPDGKIGWRKFAPRLSKTILRWTMKDGVTPGIEQLVPTMGSFEIPDWKLTKFILDQEGSNYEGISLLRSAYKNYFFKDLYYKIDSIATEKQGLGIPILTTPPNAKPEDVAKAEEIVKNMRVNEMSYARLPQGFKIEMMDMKGNQIKNVETMIMHHDRGIAKAFLAQFLEIGSQGSSGAYSASQDQSDLFYMGIEHIAALPREIVNRDIRDLVDINFGPQAEGKYPTIEHGSVRNVDSQKFATALNQLASGQILIPDDELEEKVRATLDLPEKMEGYDRETIEKKKLEQTQMEFQNSLHLEKQKATSFATPPSKGVPPKKLVNAELRESLEELQQNIKLALNEDTN